MSGKLIFVLAAVFFANPAHACRVFLAEETRLERAYVDDIVTGVALVRIDSARQVGPVGPDSNPWVAEATVGHVVSGNVASNTTAIEGGRGSSMCELNPQIAEKGALWVVYYWGAPGSSQKVWLALPFARAWRADAQLRQRLGLPKPY